MTTSTSLENNGNPFRSGFWNARKWFLFLVIALLAWTGIYLIAHTSMGINGYEYTKLNNTQIRQINRILTTEASILPEQNTVMVEQAVSVPATVDTQATDNASGAALAARTPPPVRTKAAITDNQNNTVVECDEQCRVQKALLYIRGEFEDELMPEQLDIIEEYIYTFDPQEAGIFLADHKIKVRSFFWLSGPMAYAEIIFWVIIGVLCSLLFTVGITARKDILNNTSTFNSSEIIYQVAKIFYAPFSAIIIVLAYSYFTDGTTLNINASEGMIVFGFIAGFYSGRVMNFLDKFKQLILPSANGNGATPISYTAPQQVNKPQAVAETQVPAKQSQQILFKDSPPPADNLSQTRLEQEAPLKPERNVHEGTSMVNESGIIERLRTKNSGSGIDEVDIDLRLDLSGLQDDEKSQLQQIGFQKAIVTLHNVNGKDIIPAKKLEEDTSTFVASDVKPGIYIARATLSQKLKDNHIVNLFGEKTAYVTADKPGLELHVKKYVSTD